jgi:hypothetical protein
MDDCAGGIDQARGDLRAAHIDSNKMWIRDCHQKELFS